MKKLSQIRVGSRIVISQPSENYICEVVRIQKNPKCNGLKMDYYLLDEAQAPSTQEKEPLGGEGK